MNQESKIRYMGGIICGSSAVDQTTQNLSAFNIIDQINVNAKSTDPLKSLDAQEKLVIPITLQVITLWKRANVKDLGKEIIASVEVEIKDVDGKSLQTIPVNFPIPQTVIRSRYILNIQGMPVTKTGEYSFEFREVQGNGGKSELLAKLCVDVIVNRQ